MSLSPKRVTDMDFKFDMHVYINNADMILQKF